jgi:ABC-type multidrug transport system fused ATPase/permease subunit
MKNIKNYFKTVKYSLGMSFRFVKKDTYLVFSVAIVSALLGYVNSYILGKLVNEIVKTANGLAHINIWVIPIVYAVAAGMPQIFGNYQAYVIRRRMLRLQMETDLEVLKIRERIDIANYENPQVQNLVQRAFRLGPNPIWQLGNAQVDGFEAAVSFVVGTALALHYSFLMYLIVIVSAIPAFIIDVKYAGKSWSIWSSNSPEQRKLANLRLYLMTRYQLIETKLLQSGNKILGSIRKIFTDFKHKQESLETRRFLDMSITDALSMAGYAAGMVIIVRNVASGVTDVGTLVFMIGVLNSVRGSIANLLKIISSQYENHLIVKDIIAVTEIKPVVTELENPTRLNLKSAPEIVFENVSFKYAGSNVYSLENISLTFKAGDNIGLVGNNGAGKTTLIKLLCRIYDPTDGRILVNGIDLRDVSLKEWWSYMAVMLQDYASYDFLVKEAIAIGRPDKPLNLTKVVEAAHTSQAYTFIEEWKNKYDEQLGVEFGGKEPSKGQKQKLSIAKTLYRDGFVMILDEPTASVDAESESKIFDSIESLPKDRTAILISHDFSTISACDKIFIIVDGKLAEEGNHKELMAQKGRYAELYNLQAKRFKK